MRSALFRLSTLPPARLSSGWVATGAHYLPNNSPIRGRPGRILPPLKHGMHPFYRHFRNRMLSLFVAPLAEVNL